MRSMIFWVAMILPFIAMAQVEQRNVFDTSMSWEQLSKKARGENKYIFVDVFTTWCGPCKLMDQNVYTNDTVSDLLKDRFISVKLQMDSTRLDNEYVRKWYTTAHSFSEKYQFAGYPSFLFFSPRGELLAQELGYKNVAGFVDMSRSVLDPRTAQFKALLDQYKKGIKNYSQMQGLAQYTWDVVKDRKLATKIAADYKLNYLDSAPDDTLCTSDNLNFIGRFNSLMHVDDGFFRLCYNEANLVDSTIHIEGWSDFQVRLTVARDEVVAKLTKDGKANGIRPDWAAISDQIRSKYNIHDLDQFILEQKLDYYRFYNPDWRKWAETMDEKFKAHPVVNDGNLAVMMQLNMPAWDVFLNCNDKIVLKRALEWSDLSIKLESSSIDVQYLDTRAQLLYKLGEVNKAIEQQKKVVEMSEALKQKKKMDEQTYLDVHEHLTKMQKRQPTWIHD